MMTRYWFVLPLAGFLITSLFAAFFLVPSISDVQARQLDVQMLEIRARVIPDAELQLYEGSGLLRILSKDELFSSLANAHALATYLGLNVTAFTASEIEAFGRDVSETTVSVSLYGCFEIVMEYVYYLAGSVYGIRYLSFVNAQDTGVDIRFSVFHENHVAIN